MCGVGRVPCPASCVRPTRRSPCDTSPPFLQRRGSQQPALAWWTGRPPFLLPFFVNDGCVFCRSVPERCRSSGRRRRRPQLSLSTTDSRCYCETQQLTASPNCFRFTLSTAVGTASLRNLFPGFRERGRPAYPAVRKTGGLHLPLCALRSLERRGRPAAWAFPLSHIQHPCMSAGLGAAASAGRGARALGCAHTLPALLPAAPQPLGSPEKERLPPHEEPPCHVCPASARRL